jgi:hypothetical protein
VSPRRWRQRDATRVGPGRFEAARLESRALRQMSAEARARARATRDQARRGRSQREILRDSAFARLQARQQTIAVIEQAKGIIMARQGCRPEEAFDLLRRGLPAEQYQGARAGGTVRRAPRLRQQPRQRDAHHTGCRAVPAAGNAGTATRRRMLTRLRG